MPSLNLRNPFRRNPDRPSLRDRATALKAAAAKVIRRPEPAAPSVAPAPAEAWIFLDAALLSRVRELAAIEAEQTAILEAGDYADAFDAPDWVRLERHRETVLVRVIATRAHTMAGLKAKASLFALESVRALDQPTRDLSRSIVADVAALDVARQPEEPQASPVVGHVDPHLALLPALRQAYAWTRDAVPIISESRSGSTEHHASVAVQRRCWNLADRILVLPAPKTPAGLGAVALAMTIWGEGSIPRDPEGYEEERRTASAVRAMMSVAGVEALPEWTGFGDEPDSRARWGAMMARAGEGSLPAWALAGKSGPDAEEAVIGGEVAPTATGLSDLAQACIGLVERRAWADRCDNAETLGGDDGMAAEIARHNAVFRRAIDEPSANMQDLAAKARLMLDDLDRFHPEEDDPTDDYRLMRVILREAAALAGKSGLDGEGAVTTGGATAVAPVVAEAPASPRPTLDLSACSIREIARLYEAFDAVWNHLSALGQCPCFWEPGFEAGRRGFNPAGSVVDQEADRLARLASACAEEIARRTPQSDRDANEALMTRLRFELTCEGRIHDPALMRDVATAAGA